MSSTAIPKVVPAQLSFLAIYNPSLGSTDETFHQQVVFYYSKTARARSRNDARNPEAEKALKEEENEKLRQVGLAQGMVGFAQGFSTGATVDSVETEKSRIVLHELEKGWWILASIDLTQLPAHHPTSHAVEYSSREVSPPALLLQQLVRAHNVFLLHHGETLSQLHQKLAQSRFLNILDRYWSRFASNWDVLLHGSPAVEIFGGLKLAAGGELGMGVGEEEWGSGERLVLEDYVHKTDGLLDLMVSRFGDPSPAQELNKSKTKKPADDNASNTEPWIGSGRSPEAADGIIFSGIGAVSRNSLRHLSHWVESIYCYGDHAYGVKDNPTADRRRRPRLGTSTSSVPSAEILNTTSLPSQKQVKDANSSLPPGIPPPIVKTVEASLNKASAGVDANNNRNGSSEPYLASLGDTDMWMKYLTLGYGTAWGGKKAEPQSSPQDDSSAPKDSPAGSMRYVDPKPDVDPTVERLQSQIQHENTGYFAIGLKGNMEERAMNDNNEDGDWNQRIVLRTVYVELNARNESQTPTPSLYEQEASPFQLKRELSFTTSTQVTLTRLRPVVYVHRPFIYTFLFKHRTESLDLASFYHDLHTYFSPLHRLLSSSTSPHKVAARLLAAFHPFTTSSSSSNQDIEANIEPIYDLAYDPRTLTVHSSLPNIPEPGTLIAEGLGGNSPSAGWSRVEALNVHSQIIATITSTRRNLSEIERTCKTSRGWWVVWMRLPPSQQESNKDQDPEAETEGFDTDQLREAFLVRRARDAPKHSAKTSGGRFGSGMWGPSAQKTGGSAAGWGPKGLGEGIGIDARKYVEGLLSLNR